VTQLDQEDYQPQDLSLINRMIRVFFAPSETYEAVSLRHSWLDWFVPVVLVIALSLVALQITMPVIMETQKEVLQERLKDMPEEQRQQTMDMMQKTGGIASMVTVPVLGFILLFIIAGILLLIARFGLGGEVSYGQMLAVWGYSSLIGIIAIIVRTPLMLAKETAMVHTGLGMLVPDEMMKTFLGRVLAGVDLFTFWQICVASVGLAVLTRNTTSKALVFLLILWAIWILIQAALGGLGMMG